MNEPTHAEAVCRRLGHSCLQKLGRLLFKDADSRSPDASLDLGQTSSILILRLDEIGDTVLMSPFLRELRRNSPQAWITLLVKSQSRNHVEFCPYVNEVLAFEWGLKGRIAWLSWFSRRARAMVFAGKHLWRRFDLAIVPRFGVDYSRATLFAFFSGTPRRVAYSEYSSELKARLNPGYDRLLTHALEGRGLKHQVEWNLDCLQQLGGKVKDRRLELWLTEEDRAFARKTLAAHLVRDGELLIAFAPGASEMRKVWPLERWIELGRQLNREFEPRLAVVGGERERDLGACIEKALGSTVINLVGRATLRQTSAILERCSLTVSNDSGPMHLSAAAGCAVVEISCHPRDGDPNNFTSPVHFHPWGVPYDVLQPERAIPPCRDSCEAQTPHCILAIEVESVQQAVRNLLPRLWASSPERREAATAD